MNKPLVTNFKNTIRRILNEETEKKSDTGANTFTRVPEIKHDSEYKKVIPHERSAKSKDELLDEICKLVTGINTTFTAELDDHDDISISAGDLFSIRIIPKWDNNYCIETFIRKEDRIYITGQNWDQVKEFVKVNLKDSVTNTKKAFDKVDKNRKDQISSPDKGLPQKDKPKTLPLTNEPIKTAKNSDNNYTEESKDNDDSPDKPMKEVPKDSKKLSDYKVKTPEKPTKHKKDTKLVLPDKKTPKFKETK